MLNDQKRLEIWRRDHFRCVYCGYDGSRSFKALRYLTVDHLKPKAKNGSDAVDNLFTACRARADRPCRNSFLAAAHLLSARIQLWTCPFWSA